MPADDATPLATADQFMSGAFADLAQNLQAGELDDIMIEATRACESIVDKRLAPFTITESQRAEGIDPDEYGSDSSSIPMDLPGTVGRSYAASLGAADLVRHAWLREYAIRYQELWTPYTLNAVTLVRSYGGSQIVVPGSIIGPEPDSGHVWFQIGTFLPVGSLLRFTYSGGYSTVPSDLVRACKSMAASIIIKELDPAMNTIGLDPDLLRAEAMDFLGPYMEGTPGPPGKKRGR